ncbi:MAG: SDR family oxidoreductase [Chloroflexota bacterium]
MRLANKIAVITGAASGFGRASSVLFAQKGAKIVVADVNDAGGQETVNMIKGQGSEAIFVHTDVSKAEDVQRLIKTAVTTFGRIDILFNNAGIPQKKPVSIYALEETEWDRLFAVNVKSVYLGAKYAAPEMRKQGGGVIINTASASAIAIRTHLAAYVSSKGAVITLTKALALELARYKIRVNCPAPVAAETPMLPSFMPEGISLEEARKQTAAGVPMGRLAQPEDIAYAALFLASDESSLVSGVTLSVDGARGLH